MLYEFKDDENVSEGEWGLDDHISKLEIEEQLKIDVVVARNMAKAFEDEEFQIAAYQNVQANIANALAPNSPLSLSQGQKLQEADYAKVYKFATEMHMLDTNKILNRDAYVPSLIAERRDYDEFFFSKSPRPMHGHGQGIIRMESQGDNNGCIHDIIPTRMISQAQRAIVGTMKYAVFGKTTHHMGKYGIMTKTTKVYDNPTVEDQNLIPYMNELTLFQIVNILKKEMLDRAGPINPKKCLVHDREFLWRALFFKQGAPTWRLGHALRRQGWTGTTVPQRKFEYGSFIFETEFNNEGEQRDGSMTTDVVDYLPVRPAEAGYLA